MGRKDEIPMVINGEEVKTGDTVHSFSLHKIMRTISVFIIKEQCRHVDDAINSALAAKKQWNELGWEHRAAIFLKQLIFCWTLQRRYQCSNNDRTV
ncbi:hypothetical protein [Chryseobacterium indoltheticum]|uniref:hypothetical protein n=1 Tax=Chryseobacterium indoltheticum TaxID=254 RepID=UPI003F494EB0